VFTQGERIFRAVKGDSGQLLRDLHSSQLLSRLSTQCGLVDSQLVEETLRSELSAEFPAFELFFEHERVAPLSYPHEWSSSMLAEAAIHTLQLQAELLNHGLSLKDATAYNVQFVAGKPVFLDLTSIEKPLRLDVWYAMGQFGSMFTYPLLLCRYKGWDLRSYFLGELGGRSARQVLRGLGWLERWLPRFLLDVTLPALLEGRGPRAKGEGVEKSSSTPAVTRPAAQQINLGRLERKIRRLELGCRGRSTWSDYTQTCSYEGSAQQAKRRLVQEFLSSSKPETVLDAGCNTGDYSYLAVECGARVLATDADPEVINALHARLQRDPQPISPFVVDLCNPGPAIGYCNRERSSWLSRARCDGVIALALIHHLRVSGNLPLAHIRDLFLQVCRRVLVLEFVPVDDPMFQQLTAFRSEDFSDYSLEACKAEFSQSFSLVREEPIPDSPRTMLLWEVLKV
jgi:SAM-dependent methyltransferase